MMLATTPTSDASSWRSLFTQPHVNDSALVRGAGYGEQPACLSVCVSFVCLSESVSRELLDRSSRNFVCGSPVAVARSPAGGVAICYVLPVLWMTSRLDVMATSGGEIPGQSLMYMNALLYI